MVAEDAILPRWTEDIYALVYSAAFEGALLDGHHFFTVGARALTTILDPFYPEDFSEEDTIFIAAFRARALGDKWLRQPKLSRRI